MKIVINRDTAIEPLLIVAGVVDRKQTVPVLFNLLFNIQDDELEIIATDMEVEMKARIPVETQDTGSFTLPAKKLTDIVKSLYEGSRITIKVDGEKAIITSGRSKFRLGVLPAEDFPSLEMNAPLAQVRIQENILKDMIDKTYFAMAVQDVRYYLNGMLLDLSDGEIATVATDGHRLAYNRHALENDNELQVIMPVKSVNELRRLLDDEQGIVDLSVTGTHIQIQKGNSILISKLVDGRYPDYHRVIPLESGQVIQADREELRQALVRTSILSNIKFRGINIEVSENELRLLAHNPEQEEAEEIVSVEYSGPQMSVGFNVGYMIEVLGTIEEDKIQLWIANSESSCLIKGVGNLDSRYVIMPLRV